MKKSLWIFLLAVLVPSVVLGWLALRSAGEQQIILERRTAELYQKQTDSAADAVRALVDEERRAFNEAVRRLLAGEDPATAANEFPTNLGKTWPRKAIGFAIGKDGRLLAPNPQRAQGNRDWQRFLVDNGSFLAGSTPATVYWVSGDELARPEQLRGKNKASEGSLALNQGAFADSSRAASELNKLATRSAPTLAEEKASAMKKELSDKLGKDTSAAKPVPPIPAPLTVDAPLPAAAPLPQKSAAALKKTAPAAPAPASPQSEPQPLANLPQPTTVPAKPAEARQQAFPEQTKQQGDIVLRNVAPQRVFNDNTVAFSNLTAATADFRELTSGTDEGVITRFVQDKLEIMFWLRPAQAPEMVFGCLIRAEDLRDVWNAALPMPPTGRSYDSFSRRAAPEFVLALLDDKTRPVATQPPTANGRDWKRPFVASEIGEALPHWEAALYLQRPEQLRESARVVRQTLVFLIAAALAVIMLGGWLVAADVRRQLALAQQKTDFVSNVSHELKTPLTSIRMFAELMQNGRGSSTEKHPQYLRIIMVEAERLTRLINNVLDFARLERKQKQFDKKPLDLHAVIERTWEGHELHLQESGFTTRWQAAPGPYPVIGDEDALAQILVNLLSNAEKYAGERKDVELHTYLDAGHACVSVLDRGLGVPPGDERKIFESFYRAHDSLSSGIQGSGLGLTLAQQLAREHGGEILYQPRPGGGSNFTLRLPLAPPTA